MNMPVPNHVSNRPFLALIKTFNDLPRSAAHDYAFVRDEWRCRLANPDEDFSKWLDFAFTVPSIKRACRRTFFECGYLSRCLIYVDQAIEIEGVKDDLKL